MFDLLKLNCPVFRDCFSESVQNVDGERGAQVLLFTRLAAEFREECSYEWSRLTREETVGCNYPGERVRA